MAEHFASFKRGEKATEIGFLVVTLIGVIKGLVGLTSGSISLLAQAVESLTDLFGLVSIFVGIRLSQKAPSDRFPYGYYRAETFASLIVSILILMTGIGIIRESVLRVLQPKPVSTPLNAVIVVLLSIPVLYLLSRYIKRIGEEINSQSLLGQAADFTADIYSSFLVLIGVVGSQFGYTFVESIAGSIISLLVLKTGLVLGWNALLVLMDAVVKPERMELLKQVAEGVTGVRSASNIRIRRSGPFCFGELTIGVDQRLSVEQAHRLSEEIEKRAKEKLSAIESLLVHIEPQEQTRLRIAIPILEDRGMNSQSTPHFGSAPFFLFVDIEDGSIQSWMTRSNPGRSLERKRGVTTSDLLMHENVNTLLTGSLGAGPFHILRDSFIEIYELPEKIKASNAVKDFLERRLERMKEAKEEKKHN